MEINQIKQQLPIKTVLSHYNLTPDKNGMLNCPFHEDKTPSMQIYPRSNTFCCFSGNCEAGTGDQIQFIELKEKQGKHQAIEKAKELSRGSTLNNSKEEEKEDLNELFIKLKQNINKSPRAKEYLAKRNLTLQHLEVGFNVSSYKSLKNCIIFPLKNKYNQVVSLYGRSVMKTETNNHYYTKNRKGLHPKYPPAETRKLILTESIIDAVTLQQQTEITKEYEILALYGTNGLTKEHTAIISQLKNLKELVLWFDGDKAGKEAIKKYRKQLGELTTAIIYEVETPQGEDINSLLDGHDPEILKERLNNKVIFSSIEQEAPAGDKTKPEPKKTSSSQLVTSNPEYIIYQKGALKCTLIGGISLTQLDRLRVTLGIERVPKLSPLHSIRQSRLDLYNDNFVEKFVRATAEKLETGTSEIRLLIAELIEELEKYRLSKLESKKDTKPKFRILTSERKEAGLKYLKAPKLLSRTNQDIGKSGVVGEEINRLLMYLTFTGRLRESPLHIISLGASGTGKTYLQEKVAELIPEQDVEEITALSDNAFYYFGEFELQHKIILIEDMDGAENVMLPLQELMSKKRINRRVTAKDSKGNMGTIQLKVEGPVCVAGTTTKEKIYEDNANRSLLIYRDNSLVQQEKIMNYQRKLSAGKINKQEENRIKELFKDMQTLLKSVQVINPYAEQLNIPPEVFKPLRTNNHYLQFIECITFYHQYQRPLRGNKNTNEQYIETTLEDIESANYLLKEVLLAKSDELSGACRSFFEVLKAHLKKEKKLSFYAKEIRAEMRLNPKTLSRYLYDLKQYNYVKIVGGDKFRKGYEYEIISYEEYKKLGENITNALDEALAKIKKNIK